MAASLATMAVAATTAVKTTVVNGLSGFFLFPASAEITIPAANRRHLRQKPCFCLCGQALFRACSRILTDNRSYVLKIGKAGENMHEQGRQGTPR